MKLFCLFEVMNGLSGGPAIFNNRKQSVISFVHGSRTWQKVIGLGKQGALDRETIKYREKTRKRNGFHPY